MQKGIAQRFPARVNGGGALLLALPLLASLAATGCGGTEAAPTAPADRLYENATAEAGFHHRHHRPALDPKLDPIMPWVSSIGAAAAAGDFNRDGFIDLYVTDSRKGEPSFLYRNNGDGTFTDVAAEAGVAAVNGEQGVATDCAWGDVDADGWPDLYIARWGKDALFHNNGDGTFTDVTERLFARRDGSPGTDWANSNAVVFFDYDLDGRLDLYVGNYFEDHDLWHLTTTRIMHDSFETSRNAGVNHLYHQQSDGTFVEQAAEAGVDDTGWTLSVGSADIDNDGWPDLWAADDFGPDQVFVNRRDGTFANVSREAIGPDTKKGMNVDFGDFNNDGWLDVYTTNITTAEYLQEGNMLWHNNGPGADGVPTFTDVALESGTYDGGWGWGAKFFDADQDGDLDLVSGNGFISAGEGNFWYDLASWTVTGEDSADAANWPPIGDRTFSGYEALRFWRNDGFGTFSERAAEVGLVSDHDGRGVVVFDADNDGDLDVYVANQHQQPDFFRHRGGAGNWLGVALVADPSTGTNPDAVGARVTVVAGERRMIRERDGGNSFAGQSDPRLHFGLGEAPAASLVEVRWPDGGLQYLEEVAANQYVTVRQDPAHYADRVRLEVAAPEVEPRHDSAVDEAPKVDPAVADRRLTLIEEELRQLPDDWATASDYRHRAAEADEHDRAIRFFQQLAEQHPDEPRLAIELSAAYIDKIPTCGGVAAVVCKGRLAKLALDRLDPVLTADPDWWVALYSRGMNHLHWPRALRHSDDAAADFARAVAVQERRGDLQPYYLRSYVGLGDAYVKDGEIAQARRAWEQGLRHFPDAPQLTARLAIDDDRLLLDYVEDQRNLERPIDTDFSFLDPAGD